MKFPEDLDPVKLEKYWTKKAEKVLLGKTIVKVHYMPKKVVDDWGWYKRPIMFTLNDGTLVIAQMDDEGNDGGVLWSKSPSNKDEYDEYSDETVMPVL